MNASEIAASVLQSAVTSSQRMTASSAELLIVPSVRFMAEGSHDAVVQTDVELMSGSRGLAAAAAR